MKIEQVTYTALKERRNAKRLWLEGLRLADCGFVQGAEYTVAYDMDNNSLELILAETGKGTHKVAGRKRRGSERVDPIIDLCNKDIVDVFGGAVRVRTTLFKGRISVSLHHEERARIEREERTRDNLANGQIKEGTLCAGIGVATHATHEGLKMAGVESSVEWIVDVEGRYLQVAVDNNPAVTEDTRLFEAKLEEIEAELLGYVDYMQMSLPCTGHSKSGKSKNGIKNAEEHDEAATSVFGFFNILKAVNPSIVVSENVVEAQDSATYTLIKQELKRRGYVVHEKILGQEDAGTLESRTRYWFVAVSEGLAEFDLNDLPQFAPKHEKMGDIEEAVDPEDKMWADNQYLKDKSERDAAAGKGFAKRQLITAESTKVGTIGRHYMKRRSTEPFWTREDGKERLLTVNEHCAVKDIPAELVKGCLPTIAHEGLGQSILHPHAVLMAMRIGEGLMGKQLTTGVIAQHNDNRCEQEVDIYFEVPAVEASIEKPQHEEHQMSLFA